jgi:hypothetical protein
VDPTFLAFFAASAATVPHISAYLTDIVAILGFCAVLATKLPHPQSKDSFYAGLFSTINFLGQNYGAAANLVKEFQEAEVASAKPVEKPADKPIQ